MQRRTWIKLYVDQCLRGSMMTELRPDERFVWFGFLLLAGDCAHEGRISVTETTGYTDAQLADLLKVEVELIRRSKKKFLKYGKVEIDDGGIIRIVKWQLYQSEYLRQKSYRVELQNTLSLGVTNPSPSPSPSTSPLYFNFDTGEWEGVTDAMAKGWKEAYPACDIGTELLKMREWILSAGAKGHKSNWRMFIVNWLKRCQDSGGTRGYFVPSREAQVGRNTTPPPPRTLESWQALRRTVEREMRSAREALVKAGKLTQAEADTEVAFALVEWEKRNPRPK